MSVMIACPSCQAMLRLPPGADMVRCPRCKTVLAVEASTTEAPAPKPAIPLPFGQSTVPAPTQTRPVASPATAPPVLKASVRGKLVREEDEDDDRRRRKPSIEEEEEAAEQRKLERLEQLCRPARTGMTLMAFGAVTICVGSIFFFIFSVTTLVTSRGIPALLLICGAFTGIHTLLTMIGFGFCIGGPKNMRSMAIAGLVIILLHGALYFPLAMPLASRVSLDELGLAGEGGRNAVGQAMLLSSIFNNLVTVTDLPIYLLSGAVIPLYLLILPLLGGALEFAKLSLVGIIANQYAVDGKDRELAHDSLRFVYRIFWLVIAMVVFKIGLWFLVKITGGEPLLMMWFAIPLSMLTNGYFLWWTFAWYAQYRTLMDITEILVPARLADSRQHLDVI